MLKSEIREIKNLRRVVSQKLKKELRKVVVYRRSLFDFDYVIRINI